MIKINNPKIIILIAILVILVYANTLGNLFVWDDAWNITNNDFIQSWKNLPLLFKPAYLTEFHNFGFLGQQQIGSGEVSYRPVTTLSYFIDYAFWGMEAFGYHLTNLLIHLFNTILLYFFAARLTKIKTIAFFSSLLFALHPVNSEAVAVISFREDLLAFLFFMVSLLFYVKLYDSSGFKRAIIYVLSLLSFLVALFSKEMAFTLPFILVLYDFYFSPHKKSKLYYWGYLFVCVFALWVWAVLMRNPTKVLAYPGGSFLANLFTMSGVIATYIRWAVWPVGIHAVVPDNAALILHVFTFRILIYLTLIAALFLFAVKKYKTAKVVSFSLVWFFITLLLVSNIIPVLNTIMASRFLYIPMAGFCLGLVNFLYQPEIPRKSTIILMVSILLFYSGLTIRRNRIYRNDLFLWTEIVMAYPDNATAHVDLGVTFEKSGLLDNAIAEYHTAIRIDSGCIKAYFGLGNCYYSKGIFKEALGEYKKGMKLLRSESSREQVRAKLDILFKGTGLDIEANEQQ